GATSPNPMVGAVLVKQGRVIGRGWHHRVGEPHAEIEALRDAQKQGANSKGATLYVTLEPCCTQGRTPPCTAAIMAAGIRKVVVGATDPNPHHCGKAFTLLKRAGIAVTQGVLAEDCQQLNEAFNHWIVQRTPWVTVKAAMTLDGKIATAAGESKWITGEASRAYAMKLRQGADAILVGINTVLADDPALTFRLPDHARSSLPPHRLRRVVLDAAARTPLGAKVLSDEHTAVTTIVVGASAPKQRVAALARQVRVLVAPTAPVQSPRFPPTLDLRWLLQTLGSENVTSLLVEGGGEVNASFLLPGLAQRIAFFYAPKILGGRDSRPGVAGAGAASLAEALTLTQVEWRKLGVDWLLTARLASS
ncbi:MAG TPA: bifunctional diaminohydroxyphosphoribosylaminopyrimidine deaminase/5-amino-6-(5-phosphoribosylamino)uracil reductase RibD, partial [Bacillota bacterium]|nr:bifunctional diaminohydroxyphosphoribosylaminopyrimidine deaminase/5-amino-6-(5-phosphoribosylamino)uracil reductase RibD [Bacillota bacterium]